MICCRTCVIGSLTPESPLPISDLSWTSALLLTGSRRLNPGVSFCFQRQQTRDNDCSTVRTCLHPNCISTVANKFYFQKKEEIVCVLANSLKRCFLTPAIQSMTNGRGEMQAHSSILITTLLVTSSPLPF